MRYQLKTVLMGLLATPPLASIAVALATGFVPSTAGKLAVGVLVALLVTVLIWWAWGRRADRPTTWLPALLPVVAVPAVYLLFWVITYAVTNGILDTLGVFVLPGLPYLVLSAYVAFGGAPLLMPVTLATVLLGSVGGFVWGARKLPRPTGRWALLGAAVVTAALVTVCAVQVGNQVQTALLLGGGTPSMGDEVDTSAYRPWLGSKLVTPEKTASLRLAGDLPRLDGATALYPVYGAIAQAVYTEPTGLSEEARYDFVERYVPCNTTSIAYDRLIAHEADAIFVAQPSKGQLAKARAAGVELELTPIGREAFVFFVNADNPVQNLSLEQVRDIYSRRITNWRQVGGSDEPIIAFQRPDDSGSQTAMLAMVMKDRAIAVPMKEERASGMGDAISEVAQYRDLVGAIGYSFRWYATVMNSNPRIRLVSIDGVTPSVDNIRDGSYPLTANLNIVTAGTTNTHVRELIDWTVSAEGQALIEKAGYVGR